MSAAVQNSMWKEGMKVEAVYKKRKELAAYLPAEERVKLKSEKRSIVRNKVNYLPATSPTPLN
jgi:hypothetical protein